MKELLEKIKAQLLIDRKKTAVLGGLFLVLLVVAVRTFSKKEPESAVAAQSLLPPAQSATPTAQPVAQAAAPGAPALTPTAAPPQSNEPQRKTVSVSGMARDLERDPFTTPAWSKFVPDFDDSAETNREGRSNRAPFWSRLVGTVSDYRKIRKAEVERLGKELGELSLQSTLTGPFPIAYISGRLVREGDSLRGFSVLRIADRRVFLQKDGQLYCLAMH